MSSAAPFHQWALNNVSAPQMQQSHKITNQSSASFLSNFEMMSKKRKFEETSVNEDNPTNTTGEDFVDTCNNLSA